MIYKVKCEYIAHDVYRAYEEIEADNEQHAIEQVRAMEKRGDVVFDLEDVESKYDETAFTIVPDRIKVKDAAGDLKRLLEAMLDPPNGDTSKTAAEAIALLARLDG